MRDQELVRDLLAFLSVPSVTGTEDEFANHLTARLRRTGGPVVRDGSSVLVPPPEDDRPLVVLAGHIDTVPPRAGNETPRVEGAWIRGRGSVDMKSGLAVMASLLDRPGVGRGWARVGAVFYAGEEGPITGNDLGRLLEGPAAWARDAGLGILLEPTDLQIEVGCLGTMNIEATFRGEACHSARPWLGRNAVTAALPWITRISARDPIPHPLGPYTFRETASITILRAGVTKNVIPGDLTANLNYRYPPGWSSEQAVASARSLVEEADDARILDHAPAGRVPLEEPLFAAFLRETGLPSRAKQAWTDVAQLSARGVPALNFGPGDPGLAHKDEERVEAAALSRCLEVLAGFLEGSRRPDR